MSNNKQSSVDAYCNSCDAFICDALVTFEETCSNCGTQIEYFENEMSNNKQSNYHLHDVGEKVSSIDWLVEQLGKYNEEMVFLYQNEIEQAKAMHKEEIEKTYIKGYEDKDFSYFDPEQYYNETFGGEK